MNKLFYQPFLTFAVTFTVSSFLLPHLNSTARLIAMFVSLTFALASLFFIGFRYGIYKKHCIAVIIICAGIALSSCIQYHYFDKQIPKITKYSEKGTVFVTATVEKVITKSDYASYYQIKVSSINGIKANLRANLEFQKEFDADICDIISFEGSFYKIPEYENGFPAEKYYSSKGIYLNAVSDGTTAAILDKSHSVSSFFAKLSDKISAKLSFNLGSTHGSFVSGLLLGRRNEISENIKRDFKYLGISHILAISGLHLNIIVGGFLIILRAMNLSRFTRCFLCSLLTLAMMLLTGFSLTVVRAGIMMLLMLYSRLIKIAVNPLQALFTSSLIILAVSPETFNDISFLLSFSATFGLLTFGKKITSALYRPHMLPKTVDKIKIKILSSLIASVTAIIFTLPVVCCYFKEISFFSLISNLIFIPLCSLLLTSSAFSVIFTSGFGRGLFCGLTKSLSSLIVDLADVMSRNIAEPIPLNFDFVKYSFILAALSCLLIFFIKKKTLLTLLIPISVWMLSFFSFYAVHLRSTKNEIALLASNYGKNDFLLINQGTKTLICDFSDGRYSNLKDAASLVKANLHDTSADVLLLTHLHRYHISSFNRLADITSLEYLILPSSYDEQSEEIYNSLVNSAKSKNITVFTYSPLEESSVDFLGCRIKLSQISFIERSIQPIFYLTVEYGAESFTYCSSSLFESNINSNFEDIIVSSNYIWLGIHGPNIKQPFPKEIALNNSILVSEGINELYSTSFEEIDTFKELKLVKSN